jgi:hypothetical protein
MSYRMSSRRGVLIAIHERIRGVWLARLFVLMLCVFPVTAAQATIAASGNVSSIWPLGPGDTTFPSVVDTRVVAVGIDNGIGSLTGLSPVAGSARQFADRMVDSSQTCPDRAFTPFGTWAVTP